MMTLVNKFLLGIAAVVVATAATFPMQFSDLYHPQDLAQREAINACQQNSPSFVRASHREACYAQMRIIGTPRTFSEVWSKPERYHPRQAR
jgi:hypothetical protein